ncbi:HSP20-like chaperone [Lipomyces arxii]|uniref:HSP20-like chaperone n=1 Tax=Lipomyces arxii TaxID=56418 RepID=UPI0034CFD375
MDKEAVRHEWYQTSESVTVSLFIKNAPKDSTTIDIQPNSVLVSYPLATGSEFNFEIGPLAGEVDPAQCKTLVLRTKIEIKLVKKVPGKWAALESSDAEVIASTTDKPPTYPTSSKSGVKNWDSVAADLAKSALDGSEDDGGDAAMGFFKKLYADADPETQRAMMKSYTESNGTNLSTSWDTVSKGRVKTEAPSKYVYFI